MRKNIILIAIFVFVFISCKKEDSPVEPSEFGEISGIVTNEDEDTPISKVSIYTSPATSVVSTDENGQFEISNVEPGLYTVTAVKNGFDSLIVGITVTAGAISIADFILPKADTLSNEKYGSISGTIYNALSGHTISAVNLYTTPTTNSIRCGQDGKFIFENMLPGEYVISAEKTGYLSTTKNIMVKVGENSISEIELTPEDTTTVKVSGNLFGKIINSITEEPLKNVLIVTDPSYGSVLTDSLGNYEIENLPVDEYSLTITKTYFTEKASTVSILGGKNTEANFSLVPSVGDISGIVIDSLGMPIQYVEIVTEPETSSYISDAEGNFTISNIPTGGITVTASKQDFIMKSIDIIVEAGKTTEIVFVLRSN